MTLKPIVAISPSLGLNKPFRGLFKRGYSLPSMKIRPVLSILLLLLLTLTGRADDWIVYPAKAGPGSGKHIVFLTGDEEYRGEEGLPMLAKILAERHGF